MSKNWYAQRETNLTYKPLITLCFNSLIFDDTVTDTVLSGFFDKNNG